MLIQFFLKLKEAKVPVSVREFLTLLEALKEGVIEPSIDEFYQLARMTLVKDEQHFDRFDQVFGSYFNGVEQIMALAPDIPLDWLEKKLQRVLTTDEKRLAGPYNIVFDNFSNENFVSPHYYIKEDLLL